MRVAIDTNILIYAFITDDDDPRHPVATNLMIRAAFADAILSAQILGEFANVIRRRFAHYATDAADQIAGWSETFLVIPTTEVEVERGARLAHRHRLQSWDAIIWQAAKTGGADYFDQRRHAGWAQHRWPHRRQPVQSRQQRLDRCPAHAHGRH